MHKLLLKVTLKMSFSLPSFSSPLYQSSAYPSTAYKSQSIPYQSAQYPPTSYIQSQRRIVQVETLDENGNTVIREVEVPDTLSANQIPSEYLTAFSIRFEKAVDKVLLSEAYNKASSDDSKTILPLYLGIAQLTHSFNNTVKSSSSKTNS